MSCDGLPKTTFTFENGTLFQFQGDVMPIYEIENWLYIFSQFKYKIIGLSPTSCYKSDNKI